MTTYDEIIENAIHYDEDSLLKKFSKYYSDSSLQEGFTFGDECDIGEFDFSDGELSIGIHHYREEITFGVFVRGNDVYDVDIAGDGVIRKVIAI